MIISGIFSHHQGNDAFEKLVSLTEPHIIQDTRIVRNGSLNIIAGKTSLISDQGEVLAAKDSFLAGKVFRKDTYQSFSAKNLESASHNSARSFVDTYWGNYVLIRMNKGKDCVSILRDPVGQFPLFYAQLPEGGVLFSSEISIIYNMLEKFPAFNWNYFSHFLLHTFVTTESTAFDCIFELPHGCELTISASNSKCQLNTSLVWDPANYCSGYQGRENKQKEIIDTTSRVIKSWIEGAEGVFLELSGGLDSSALLLLLNQLVDPSQTLKAINKFHPESGDERKHARRVSQEVDVELIEFDTSPRLPFTPIPKIHNFHPNWPLVSSNHWKMDADMCSLFGSSKNIAHMSGHGGDHIFLAPPPVKSLSDYLVEQGKNGFSTKLKEISTIYRRPLIPVLGEACKGLLDYSFRRPCRNSLYAITQYKNAPFFNKELFEMDKTIPLHPFFSETRSKMLPGKFALIEGIYSGLSSIKGNFKGVNNTIFYPLFSQPLLELSLSTPTYESYNEDYNRYHFRKAVSDHFKTASVWRKDKAETSGMTQRGVRKNEKYLLDLCLEGVMVKEGLVNKKLLHQGIKDMAMGQGDHLWPIMNLVSAEIFMSYYK